MRKMRKWVSYSENPFLNSMMLNPNSHIRQIPRCGLELLRDFLVVDVR
jgi:hypothetical protein